VNRREDDGVGGGEQFLVVLELVELLGERLDLLHLVVDPPSRIGRNRALGL